MNAKETLDREFLVIRSKLLDVAACLDRIDRADGELPNDARMDLISQAIEIVGSHDQHRAERVQLLFSRDYDEAWKTQFKLESRV